VRHLLRIYRAIFLAEFQAAAQYRVQSVLWLLFAIIRPVIFLAAWTAAAEAQGGQIGDMTIADFAAYYVAITLVSQLTMSWNSYEFELEIRQGKLSPKLLRPLHPLHYSVVENIVFKAMTLPVLLPVLVLVILTFHARFETTWVHALLFVPSVVLAAALSFMLGWLMATVAFWFTRVHGIVHVFDRLTFLFAGQVAPLSLMGPLAAIALWLPFGYMLWAPAEILRGGVSIDQALSMIGMQVVWLGLSWVGFVMLWRLGVRQYSAVGA
jgi:ABC-2 type transport system permease protein